MLKFTKDGKFLLQSGQKGTRPGPKNAQGQATWLANSNDPANFGRVAKIFVDPKANEAYLSDGYLNKRVAVIDADTGKLKRYWGAYGNKPDDTDQGPYKPDAQPRAAVSQSVHCADLANDDCCKSATGDDGFRCFRDGKSERDVIARRPGEDRLGVASKVRNRRHLYRADGRRTEGA